jgi:16S rRNA (uracil1498-N3)-methyltransferase
MDFVVQKTTELGISQITPVMTERSVVRLDPERSRKRRQHWLRIAQNACEQCGRNVVPQIDEPLPLAEWLDGESSSGQTRILLRPSAATTLSGLGPEPKSLVVLIGPEGGLSEMEYEKAEFANFRAVSIGPRILRTETAALAAMAILQSRFGDLR